jgi:hypothetical protein
LLLARLSQAAKLQAASSPVGTAAAWQQLEPEHFQRDPALCLSRWSCESLSIVVTSEPPTVAASGAGGQKWKTQVPVNVGSNPTQRSSGFPCEEGVVAAAASFSKPGPPQQPRLELVAKCCDERVSVVV